MAAQGVDVYLDPWVKDDFEGHALCVQRIANIPESTHHGVTCQRWHVRFHEDQQNAVRWVDPGDFIDWSPALRNTSLIELTLPVCSLDQDNLQFYWWRGDVRLGRVNPAIQMPYAGRIRAWSTYTHVTDRVGNPSKATLAFHKNGVYWFGHVLAESDTICAPAFDHLSDIDGRDFAQYDRLTARVQVAALDGDFTLTLQRNLLTVLVQWGNFP